MSILEDHLTDELRLSAEQSSGAIRALATTYAMDTIGWIAGFARHAGRDDIAEALRPAFELLLAREADLSDAEREKAREMLDWVLPPDAPIFTGWQPE